MIAIICLIVGIVGFVKGRINVSKNKELRGGGMYAAATLFCLPLPLSFVAGLVLGEQANASGKGLDNSTVLIVGLLCTWVPILAGIVIGIVMSTPKNTPVPKAQGFEVKM